ncbi:DUF1850 domain-containing protein [Bacillus sp. CMF21]|uniref:DUF1850 domain-containing protein n=1 Tax=Metabacillus dongyingensis TaxID=2874282 RepID=UPI001CBC9E02|nr:DUF1850 domain-containing protein [Metabacillus dongyingensis]UAL53497.1 DUF1850 domain-containing protein [Metabacillus dongyingensis]USK29823.1 DUF1850 domain-containing protein [Bacillus sp. CMF21]
MKKKLIYVFMLFITILFILFIPFKNTVAFHYEDTSKLLAYLSVKDMDTFQIKYTHSIHLTDVIETYELSNKQIKQIELSYDTFAVGMPSGPEGDEIFERKGGQYIMSNMNRTFPFIDLSTGQVVANHRVVSKGQEYELKKYIKPGTWVRISYETMNLFQLMRGVKMNER